jgi:hypothetical protein
MTSRLLLSGLLTAPIVRRTRRDDGRLFGIATIQDTDRGEPRTWVVFVNNLELIERFEHLKDGEPVAISGPFSISADEARLVYRVTAEALIGARKERKKRSKSERIEAVDPDPAPKEEEKPFDDALPF